MMQDIPLRRLVSAIGLTVAITVAVATPSMYFIHDYIDATEQMTFKARLNAARVAQYLYTHDGMWQYQQLRLSELIQLPDNGAQPIHQKIYDLANRLVLEEGAHLGAPVVTRSVRLSLQVRPWVFSPSKRACRKPFMSPGWSLSCPR
jgi:uncharacterized protein YutD